METLVSVRVMFLYMSGAHSEPDMLDGWKALVESRVNEAEVKIKQLDGDIKVQDYSITDISKSCSKITLHKTAQCFRILIAFM